jgi:hypothetical protein
MLSKPEWYKLLLIGYGHQLWQKEKDGKYNFKMKE